MIGQSECQQLPLDNHIVGTKHVVQIKTYPVFFRRKYFNIQYGDSYVVVHIVRNLSAAMNIVHASDQLIANHISSTTFSVHIQQSNMLTTHRNATKHQESCPNK